jgi:hypothetical protein
MARENPGLASDQLGHFFKLRINLRDALNLAQ